jgi:hypothetical protein
MVRRDMIVPFQAAPLAYVGTEAAKVQPEEHFRAWRRRTAPRPADWLISIWLMLPRLPQLAASFIGRSQVPRRERPGLKQQTPHAARA